MILCRVTAQPKTSQSLWEGANLVQYAGQTFVKHEKHIYSLLLWSDRPASNIDRWYFVLLVQHVRLQQFCLVHIELESFIWQVLHSWFCSVLWWWHTLAGDTNDDGGGVVVLLDAHIHPQTAEEATKTSVGEAKTQRRIWGSDSHVGSTDQSLEVCAFKSIFYSVSLMWGTMLQMQQTILYPVSLICQDQGQVLSSRSIQTALPTITFKQPRYWIKNFSLFYRYTALHLFQKCSSTASTILWPRGHSSSAILSSV